MSKRRYEERYRSGGYDRDRDRAHDRGYMERAGDEVRSWFGDEDAERRRRQDEQRDRSYDREREWRDRHGMEGQRLSSSAWDRDRDWSERARWSDRGGDEYNRDSWRGRNQDWSSRDRDPSSRDRDWSMRDRDRDWTTRDRDREWRGSNPGYGSEREWGGRGYRGAWSADEGRAEFSGPRETFGYRYAGDTGTWERDRSSSADWWGRDRSQSATRGYGGYEQYRGRGPKGYQRSDTRIYEDICDRLSRGDVDAENIEVTVANGEVTLAGSVRDRSDKRRAEDIAEEISGVRDVHNQIRVVREDWGLGMSDKTPSNQPGSVLGVDRTSSSGASGPAGTSGTSGQPGSTQGGSQGTRR